MISVLMLAYNHGRYIERAIESVLMQQTSFYVELVIGDDGSADGTKDICEKYQLQYPGIIKYEYNEINIGMNPNFLKTYGRCTGKYIALLEGDDEWTDVLKLQKQADVMEANNDVVICYSNAYINDSKNPASNIYFTENNKPPVRLASVELIRHCVVPTCTVLFRNILKTLPEWFAQTKASAYFLFYLLSKKGDMYYLDEPTALYNHHYAGMSRLTNFRDMLMGDSLLSYKLVPYFDNNEEIREVVIRKNIDAINELFHMGQFAASRSLFQRLPLTHVKKNKALIKTTAKLFIKIYFFRFMSKRETKGVY